MASENLFVENADLMMWTLITILTPFVTGFGLIFARGFELWKQKKDDSDYKIPENVSGLIGVIGLLVSFFGSIMVAFKYFGSYVEFGGDHPKVETVLGRWIMMPLGNADTDLTHNLKSEGLIEWSFMLDPLSVIFLVVLTTVASAIHIYATGYMHADSAYTRFFGTLNFFTGSMLGFVLGGNLFTSFIFWELLGFSSYLLIGYFWPKASAAHAGRKAFMYNKVGDIAFVLGIAIAYHKAKTFSYVALKAMLANGDLTYADFAVPAILIFGAAVGKSAQVPLFGWLPEAMEGPTPVSALLHSSTMVKAGLFLIARNFFMFYDVEDYHVKFDKVAYFIADNPFFSTGNIIAWIGTLTALAGGLVALTATDIKKVLAFSTVSQLGYIGLAIGSGGVTAGFFHIISHATFKSLLFLAAGAVIHSVHSQEMADMGGLKDKMKWTYYTTFIGLFALAGLPLSSGFYSKDAVLLALKDGAAEHAIIGGYFLYWVAVFTAGVTAFYSSKLLILTFLGEPRYDKDHVHPAKAEARMKYVLIFLGALVLIESIWWTIGSFGAKGLWNFEYELGSMLGQHGEAFDWAHVSAYLPSTLAVLAGVGLSFGVYQYKVSFLVSLKDGIARYTEKIVENRFGLDLLLYWIAEVPVMWIGDKFRQVDEVAIDEFVINTVVRDYIGLGGAKLSDDIDQGGVDGFIKFLESITKGISTRLKGLQSGETALYARMMIIGVAAILTAFSLITYDIITI